MTRESDLRDRYADALDWQLRPYLRAMELRDVLVQQILGALSAARDEEVQSLRERAETAEQAVARARDVCYKAMAEKDAPGMWLVAQQVLAALDASLPPEEEK